MSAPQGPRPDHGPWLQRPPLPPTQPPLQPPLQPPPRPPQRLNLATLRQAQRLQRLQRSRQRLWQALGGPTLPAPASAAAAQAAVNRAHAGPAGALGGTLGGPAGFTAWCGPLAVAALQLLARRHPLALVLGAGVLGAGAVAALQRPATWPLLVLLARRLPPALGRAGLARLLRALAAPAGS